MVLRRTAKIAIVVLTGFLVSACADYAYAPPPAYAYAPPPGYPYPYYYAPGYAYAPAPAYYGPSVGVGFAFGGGGHHHRW